MDTLTRTGITIPAADGSDATTAFRLSTRSIGAWAEANAALQSGGTLAARPSVGKVGQLYKPTDAALAGVIYWGTGTGWATIGAPPATDAAANVGSLRTLGPGSLQAAPGNHSHYSELVDWVTPGIEVAGLTSTGVTASSGTNDLVTGPTTGRRIVKALTVAGTPGAGMTLALAGVSIGRFAFSDSALGTELPMCLPIANGETLVATIAGGTATAFATYADRGDSVITRHALSNVTATTTLVAAGGTDRTINQVVVANTGAATSVATLTFAGHQLLRSTPVRSGALITLDLPRVLPAGSQIQASGVGGTGLTFMLAGH